MSAACAHCAGLLASPRQVCAGCQREIHSECAPTCPTPAAEVRVSARGNLARCPLCHEPLSGALQATRCDGCGVSAHVECTREMPVCPTLGCARRWPALRRSRYRQTRDPAAAPAGGPDQRPLAARARGLLPVFAGGLVLLLLGLLSLSGPPELGRVQRVDTSALGWPFAAPLVRVAYANHDSLLLDQAGTLRVAHGTKLIQAAQVVRAPERWRLSLARGRGALAVCSDPDWPEVIELDQRAVRRHDLSKLRLWDVAHPERGAGVLAATPARDEAPAGSATLLLTTPQGEVLALHQAPGRVLSARVDGLGRGWFLLELPAAASARLSLVRLQPERGLWLAQLGALDAAWHAIAPTPELQGFEVAARSDRVVFVLDRLYVFDCSTWDPAQVLVRPAPSSCFALDPWGQRLAVDEVVVRLDGSLNPERSLGLEPSALAFEREQGLVISGDAHGRLCVWKPGLLSRR